MSPLKDSHISNKQITNKTCNKRCRNKNSFSTQHQNLEINKKTKNTIISIPSIKAN